MPLPNPKFQSSGYERKQSQKQRIINDVPSKNEFQSLRLHGIAWGRECGCKWTGHEVKVHVFGGGRHRRGGGRHAS